MLTLLEIITSIIAVMLLIPVAVLLIQCLAASLLKGQFDTTINDSVSLAVLVPAHNEASGIQAALSSIVPQLSANDVVLVVADNCEDNTAELARATGAEVVERFNDDLRGKGYALDHGIQHLQSMPKDVLIIIDADCLVEDNAIKKLASYAVKHNRPVQGLYLMHRQVGASIKTAVAEFAWAVKNWVRPLGFAKLGLPCQLMGTGMAFPWQTLASVNLANGHIVEDMKLGADLAAQGYPPIFYPEAKVKSYFPLASEVQKGQSKRWEHGHLSVIMSELPVLLGSAIKRGHALIIAMALDLSIPPLALFVGMLVSFLIISSLMFYGFAIAKFALILGVMNLTLLLVSILLAWWGFGQQIIGFKQLLYIPVYIIQKIPSYLGFITKRQTAWNKTKRDQDV